MSSSTVPALPALNVTVSLLSPEQGWPRGLCLLDLNVLGELSPKTVVKNSNPAQKMQPRGRAGNRNEGRCGG